MQLWTEHGEQFIYEIDGSFSCLFYGNRNHDIKVYNDRFASQSVWIAKGQSISIIGNFPSALTAFLESAPKLNPAGLWSFFHTGRHVGNQGLYNNMKCLLSGQSATIAANTEPQITTWLSRKYEPDYSI